MCQGGNYLKKFYNKSPRQINNQQELVFLLIIQE